MQWSSRRLTGWVCLVCRTIYELRELRGQPAVCQVCLGRGGPARKLVEMHE